MSLEKIDSYIYPKIYKQVSSTGELMLHTWIRKEHEGKYWLILVREFAYIEDGDMYTAIEHAYKSFIANCYQVIVRYKLTGEPLWSEFLRMYTVKEDTSQITEEQRLSLATAPRIIRSNESDNNSQ